jgi:hypothetical protein
VDKRHEIDVGGRPDTETLRALVRRAEAGDDSAMPELRRVLDRTPEIWRAAGDVAGQAEEALLALAAGDNLLFRECIKRKLADLKAELAASTPLEGLVVGRVAASWLAMGHAEALSAGAGSGPASRAERLRRRADSASRRFAEAVKLLATVRKLLVPRR